MNVWGRASLVVVCALLVSTCGGGSSSTPTAPTPIPTRSATLTVTDLAVTTEREASGALAYLVTFQVRETGGAPATVSSAALTFTGPGLTGTATLTGAEALVSARVDANRTVQSNRIRSRGDSTVQATQAVVRITYAGDGATPQMAEGSTTITPAAATTPTPCSVPSVPTNLVALVSGSTVTFSWGAASGSPTDYLLGVGMSSGSSNVDTKTVSGTSFSWTSVPSGTYYARVNARNSCGTGGRSNEVTFTVGGSGGGGGSNPPSSWSGSLPGRSSGSHPVCQATLPSVAACVNNIVGPPQAICDDGAFSCSTGSGTCSGHGGVYCWRN